ncbi:hypothetical protein N657DRAFT_581708 [Parathielavia appendiculata]|uniref:Uncharacterized protein n=1 Tax=Parathielavia appendiculata TaxID=2587402 RepID=A0AAN6Z0E0_9PEZI|nr:hypothetical protein N657DRAFT_581708 [Parathielavia appendiculata]
MASQTYEDMVVESYNAPSLYNIAAGLSSWILLASFIIFPGTFTSLGKLKDTEAGEAVYNVVQHIPLLLFSVLCCFASIIGTTFLWLKFRHNHVWLLSNLIGPGLLNSISGLLTVLVGVYASHNGEWSVTAKATITIVSLFLFSMSIAFVTYRFWLLERVRVDLHN